MKNMFVSAAAILSLVIMSANSVQAKEKPDLTDIAKDKDGNVLHMNQYDAEKYCQDQGMRLPTVRELALVSQSMGAKGILETANKGVSIDSKAVQDEIAKMGKDGYYPIYAANSANQTVVDFYFSFKGYRPAGDWGRYWFWSSSVYPYYSNNCAYDLNGFKGEIDYVGRGDEDFYNAVHCIRSR